MLTAAQKLSLHRFQERLPHFSAMCTVSSQGYKFRPTFILPDEAYFMSASPSWMTQQAFLMYAHFLADELQEYPGLWIPRRETIPGDQASIADSVSEQKEPGHRVNWLPKWGANEVTRE
jgi:hypothetical protein